MKKLTQFAVNYPVTILMVILGVVLLGWISYDKLGVDLFPDLNNPRIYVEIKAGERPPEEMEKQFVKNMEALAIRQKDVIQVSSVSEVGSAQITVEYNWKKDMDEAFLDLQKALTSYSQNKELEELNITQHNPNSAPVMLIALSHDEIKGLNKLRKVAENYIRNGLVKLEGIADVELSGEEEGEVVISTDNYRLESFGLTLNDIGQSIQSFNRSVSGGSITEMGMKYMVKGVSLLRGINDFEEVIVGYKPVTAGSTEPQAGNKVEKIPVLLREVATVEFRNKKPANIVRLNGERCIGLSIFKETKFNTVKAVEQVDKALERMEKALPGYHFSKVSDQGAYINNAINEVKDTALIGILLAIFVLFLFLRKVGTTLIVSLAIPVSIIATFNLMYFNGLTINIMTLGGLALGAGMLVDNAIVVMENIFRNNESGMSVKESAITGTAQVGGAITASTLTTIVVFLPIVYLHGASGELFKDEAWTVAFSLISSLFVAIFLIPMLYYYIFRNKKIKKEKSSLKFRAYGRFLERVLNIKWVIVLFAGLLVGATMLILPMIGMEFMPPSGAKVFDMEVRMPEGTRLNRTSDAVNNLETLIREMLGDEVEVIYSHTGKETGVSGDVQAVFKGENNGSIKVVLKKDSKYSSEKVIEAISQITGGIPGLQITFRQEETALKSILGTEEAPLVVEVQGQDLEILESLSAEVLEKMNGLDGLYNLQSSVKEGSPEIEVVIDRMRAGMYNLNVESITGQIRNQLEGKDAGELDLGGEMQQIVLKLPEKTTGSLNDIIIKNGDQEVRLSEIATIQISYSPQKIYRHNQNRVVKIQAQMKEGQALDKMAARISRTLSQIEMPANYKFTISGEEAKRKESMKNLNFALLLSIVLVYMVLASQFESLVHPFTILLTIPLAGVGAVFLFWMLGRTLNIMAIIGIILLVGIAVNDSIILVDRINQLRAEGIKRRDAIVLAGRQRIRPIIMTSLTTVLALLPLTIGFGENVALRSPMALAVIGGLVTSTLLTLVVIPCMYDILDRFKEFFTGSGEKQISA
jgi:HAE1 family hydrophobic/amphiphilic exporter-1